MRQAPIDELLKQCHSIYKLTVMAAKRAKALSEGTPKFISSDMKKVTSIALEEIHQGKIALKESGEKARKGKGRAEAKKKKSPDA